MVEKKATVTNKTGLHARPAALFVQLANRFKSDIALSKDGRECNAKSIIGVLTLGVGQGSEIIIRAEGEDEDLAVQALVDLLGSFAES